VVVAVLAFVALQSALTVHALSHDDFASERCFICHNATSTATPTSASGVIGEVGAFSNVAWFPLVRTASTLELAFFMPTRGPPQRII
jgi:hypothetical protein